MKMLSQNFMAMLRERQEAANSLLCVGLDPVFPSLPKAAQRSGNECVVSIPNTIVAFNDQIIEATHEFVCTYKLNIAFYLKYGSEGIDALTRTFSSIRVTERGVPIILDVKWGGAVPHENEAYAYGVFTGWGQWYVDAITVNPLPGQDALAPILGHKDKGVFVLCLTSNSGAGEFQDMFASKYDMGSEKLYGRVAEAVVDWNVGGNCGLVVGATRPHELKEVREIVGDMPILVPGIGAQGGDIEKIVQAGKDSRGQGLIISASRSVIFASSGPDFAERAGEEAKKLRDEINKYR